MFGERVEVTRGRREVVVKGDRRVVGVTNSALVRKEINIKEEITVKEKLSQSLLLESVESLGGGYRLDSE